MSFIKDKLIMKSAVFLSFSLLFNSLAMAIPNDPKISDFSHISKKNPFKLLVEKEVLKSLAPEPEKREKFFLKGVTELSSGWLVVIASDGDPKTSIMIRSDQSKDESIQVMDVVRDKLDYRKTKVELNIEGEKHTIGYNPADLIKVSKAVVKGGQERLEMTPQEREAASAKEQTNKIPKRTKPLIAPQK